MKKRFERGVVSLDGGNLLEFYYLSGSEIWPDKKEDLWLEWPYQKTLSEHRCPQVIGWVICVYGHFSPNVTTRLFGQI
jgi:hypothetical protein